jgi:hypothetical protein
MIIGLMLLLKGDRFYGAIGNGRRKEIKTENVFATRQHKKANRRVSIIDV